MAPDARIAIYSGSAIHDAERDVLKAAEVAWEAHKAIPNEEAPVTVREFLQGWRCLETLWRAVERMVEARK